MEFITREAVPWLRWLVAGFSLRCQANPCKICREKYGTRTGLHPRILVSFVVYTLGNDLVTFAETRKFAYRRCAKHAIIACYYFKSRSRWQRGLRCGSAAARLLGLLVQIPLSAWPSLSLENVCCQVEFFASGWSLIQRTPTECGVSVMAKSQKMRNALAHQRLLCHERTLF